MNTLTNSLTEAVNKVPDIHSNSSLSSEASSSRFKVIKPDEISALDIFKTNASISLLSRMIGYDPIQLSPCGHICNAASLALSFDNKQSKICLECSKTYTFGVELLVLKNFLRTLRTKISSPPESLINSILVLFNTLPENEDKLQLNAAINSFKSGEPGEAIRRCIEILIKTANDQTIIAIFKQMNNHHISIFKKNPSEINNPIVNEQELVISNFLSKSKFLDLMPMAELICPISKQIMTEPYQLNPCGHNVDKKNMITWYAKNKSKICFRCSKPYSSSLSNLFLHNVCNNFLNKLKQPTTPLQDKLKLQITTLTTAEANSEKLQSVMGEFFSGKISNASLTMMELAIGSRNSELYMPLINLMNEYTMNVDTDISELIRLTLEPTRKNVESTLSDPLHQILELKRKDDIHPINPTPPAIQNTPSIPSQNLFQPLILTQSNTSNSPSPAPSIGKNLDAHIAFEVKKRPLNDLSLPAAKRPKVTNSNDRVRSSKVIEIDQDVVENTEALAESSNKTISTFTAAKTTASPTISTDPVVLALFQKIINGKGSIISHLNSTNVHAIDDKGNTPLHMLVLYSIAKTETIDKMMEYKADLNAQNFEGQTALHIAVKLNKIIYITKLLKLGASTKIVDNNNKRPSELAAETLSDNIRKILEG